ncbi:MAG: hypothetical protein RLZZ292_2381, partial [Bacteroidota bacterium]
MIQEKQFKILSIDGGGVKGLYCAKILAHLEQEYGNPISDYFDMICGTSTGGLIALALSIKVPASDIVKFYEDDGGKIFHTSSKLWAAIKQILFNGKYGDKNLKAALFKVFKDKTMLESSNLLCIPSYDLIKGSPRMFKYPHKEGNFFMDGQIKMTDVALATSAAPTYLPIAKIKDNLFIDGGIWANNPALCGYLEGIRYFVGRDKAYSSMQILSVASVTHNSGWSMNSKFAFMKFDKIRHRSFALWRGKLFDATMNGQNYFTDFFLQNMNSGNLLPGYYHRIQSPVLAPNQIDDIDLDKVDKNSIKLLAKLGDDVGSDYRASKKFYIEPFF